MMPIVDVGRIDAYVLRNKLLEARLRPHTGSYPSNCTTAWNGQTTMMPERREDRKVHTHCQVNSQTALVAQTADGRKDRIPSAERSPMTVVQKLPIVYPIVSGQLERALNERIKGINFHKTHNKKEDPRETTGGDIRQRIWQRIAYIHGGFDRSPGIQELVGH